jgi:RNA polymerase sigma-70 factor (ECF subfamily)
MKTKDFNRCVQQYADGLYRFACRVLGNPTDAEDVVQQVFEKFWLKKDDVQEEKVKSYLFTSVYHRCIDLCRKRKNAKNLPIDSFRKNERPDDFELRDAIQLALDQLTPIQRTVVLLRDHEGYAYDEIGEMTDLSASQVKVYIFRARKKLQLQLQQFRYA